MRRLQVMRYDFTYKGRNKPTEARGIVSDTCFRAMVVDEMYGIFQSGHG